MYTVIEEEVNGLIFKKINIVYAQGSAVLFILVEEKNLVLNIVDPNSKTVSTQLCSKTEDTVTINIRNTSYSNKVVLKPLLP